MIKNLIKTSIVASGVLATSAFAQTFSNVSLTLVGCNAGSTTCFANTTSDVGDGTCANSRQVRWDGGTSTGKNITAIMLTAKASGSPVTLGTVASTCFGGAGNFPELNFVSVVEAE